MRWACWVASLALLQLLAPALCKRHMPNLLEDDTSKKVVRAAECTFGGIGRELGSTWFADLGPPFGVMYCIKCECTPVHKKRRIVAKVQCRNIKNECPKPSCEEPVLHPGRCCKTCPGDLHSPDTPPQDLPQVVTAEEEEKDARHFAALLTGAGRPPAAIRFVLRRRSLHFSVENGAEPARLLRVLDSAGSILQEIPLAAGGTLAGRGCGAWRRLPREYRKMLRDGKLIAALLWPGETEATLTGPIVSHNALSTEMFSALLESDSASSGNGWGGTAAISVSAGAASSVHITVLFTGLLAGEHELDAPVRVTLEMVDKNTTILEEVGHIKKPSNEMNIVEFSAAVNSSDLRLLARGRLSLFLRAARPGTSVSQPYLRGPALLKLACDVFHAPLAAAPRSPPPPASGVACLHLNRDGDLIYTIQVDELNMLESPMITLIDEANKHKEETELTPYLRDGLANGSFDRMGPRLLESLYSGDLVVNVATHSDRSVIRGRIISRPVADMQDLHGPALMKRPDLTQPADIVGLAWISVDYECSVQWEISIAGPLASSLILSDLELWLDMRPMLAPGAPVISKRLGLLETPEGAMLSPALIDLQRLHSGACEVIVRDLKTNTTLLRSTLKQIKIPESCLPQQWSNNEVPSVSYVPTSQHPNSADNSLGDSCFHSGSFYEDGAQWTSANEPCTMCSCQHRTVKCDAYRCPPLSCGAKAMIKPGECCPTCSNSSLQDVNTSSTKGCYQVGQFHPAGQSWHPYLPPSGFDTCAICTCEGNPLKVQCTRVSCPFLTCSEKQAYRPDKKSCCKRCPEIKPEVLDRTLLLGGSELRDEGSQGGLVSRQSLEEVLAGGGCRYHLGGPLHNGMEWHPSVHSHGEQKCVTCRCKDGEIKCDRKRCTKSVCNSQLNQRRRAGAGHKGAPKPPPDECCQQHCRRYRRHQRHHRPARP